MLQIHEQMVGRDNTVVKKRNLTARELQNNFSLLVVGQFFLQKTALIPEFCYISNGFGIFGLSD